MPYVSVTVPDIIALCAWACTAWHSMVQHHNVLHSMAQHIMAWHDTEQASLLALLLVLVQ